ncbi:Hypothetical predicted protein [Cloeon dipterum]|uniref:Uncharacterized protein n=1 Tax=Cloeon dipterum TaxID=197152 RepID=A0A8S1BZM0_9INSE|nr:Hypothetical predicted protein [Cloeon dipterum]
MSLKLKSDTPFKTWTRLARLLFSVYVHPHGSRVCIHLCFELALRIKNSFGLIYYPGPTISGHNVVLEKCIEGESANAQGTTSACRASAPWHFRKEERLQEKSV